ncbi:MULTISPECIES: PilX N-terminal domain-containing pilus assembly protein [unclassified Duganella]|uniref:pilus assembly PilX family protein n=1 Tax=unclassified Duganella TaxID=2636909 RepID=UPI000ACB4B98|nr:MULTISPECIES: PilX N-terminal domain-containing pilus assembly protein [unclassified Duganella]
MHPYQRGVTLPVTMLLLLAALTIGASAAQMAMLGEKAARAERDRLIAFQSAEDALMDAERDINAGLSQPLESAPDARGAPAWQSVDLAGNGGTEYGALTGASMETGQGALPFRRPRYLVERIAFTPAGAPPAHYYRVTVIGFGTRPGAEAVLQASYAPPAPVHRHSWREIMDWQALHDAASREDGQ